MPRAVDFTEFANADLLACQIADKYTTWEMYRSGWLALTQEVREYIFATDTRTTSANKLPWKNSVHFPKLCQIRDNIYANLMSALMPNDKSLSWEGDDASSNTKKKRKLIRAYIQNKLRMSQYPIELAKCLLDIIDYGNMFSIIEYVNRQTTNSETGEVIQNYSGAYFKRISPHDIVFDPTVARFVDTPKIIRSIKTLGDLRADIEDHPEMGYLQEIFDRVLALRAKFKNARGFDVKKNGQFLVDGFSSFMNYFQSEYVELLDFYGDIYDPTTQKLHKDMMITVVDRAYIIRKKQNPSWNGRAPIHHCGWRIRPDNLYAMGPLDNLVGMQYRIDHLENAKADGLDLIIHPVIKIKGLVEDFEYGPGARIHVGDDGDAEFMHPDGTVLQCDNQIAMYEQKMEEMAGAPKQSSGFRTPGEKTAVEVQLLDNGANKVFVNKSSYIEEIFVEPNMNDFLEVSRRNIGVSETIRVEDEDFNFREFLKITKEDITARGKIRPIGARRFARNANLMQNLSMFLGSPAGQDEAVKVHISGKKVARLAEELLNLEDYNLVEDNIRVIEQTETQQMQASAQQVLMEQGGQPQPAMGAIPGAPAARQGSAPKSPTGMTV